MAFFDNLMRRTIIFVANIDFHLLQQLNHNLLLNRSFHIRTIPAVRMFLTKKMMCFRETSKLVTNFGVVLRSSDRSSCHTSCLVSAQRKRKNVSFLT